MKHALLALALAGPLVTGACVTTAGFVQKPTVTLPVLIGAAAADLLVTSIAASQIESYSYGGSIATGLAFTAVDFVVGCLTGACSSLRL
jgi:FtsH-binding integral membrane protein